MLWISQYADFDDISTVFSCPKESTIINCDRKFSKRILCQSVASADSLIRSRKARNYVCKLP